MSPEPIAVNILSCKQSSLYLSVQSHTLVRSIRLSMCLSISISFILGIDLSSIWFVIAQWTLVKAGGGLTCSWWAARALRQVDGENCQFEGKECSLTTMELN